MMVLNCENFYVAVKLMAWVRFLITGTRPVKLFDDHRVITNNAYDH